MGVTITSDLNKVYVDASSLQGFPFEKVVYLKRKILSLTIVTNRTHIEVNIEGEPTIWKICDTDTWLTLDENVGKKITLPVSTIDNISITSIDQLFTLLTTYMS